MSLKALNSILQLHHLVPTKLTIAPLPRIKIHTARVVYLRPGDRQDNNDLRRPMKLTRAVILAGGETSLGKRKYITEYTYCAGRYKSLLHETRSLLNNRSHVSLPSLR
jgi:hypothetical protein